ncbi:MAG TPA: thiolase family protein [Candidatus Hydrogenedentes bacterium]|nr:thiolase family protein [Candidatus Hydrogenedentota bacterium]HIJ73495.1 thiolase family protein [Candidatus Hydrogenedentota bacterium]
MQEVYIVSATRTAVGKAKRGTLAQYRPEDMAAAVVKEAVRRAGTAPERIEDVVLGCAYPEGEQGLNMARLAVFRAGLPDGVPAMTVNRFCASGLETIAIAAGKIRAGLVDIAVAGGVESMSMIPMTGVKYAPNPWLTRERPEAYIAMGHCGDNVAREFNISREDMDQWAYESHQKAIAAQDAGKFDEEIVSLEVETGDGTVVFAQDEGPRRDTSLEALANLKPAFAASPKIGSCTAGNSSQTSDGAAAVCLISERAMKDTGARALAKFLSYSVAADSPELLGPAQVKAVHRACELAGVRLDDVGLIENNEAFASQCLYVIRELKFAPEKVNVNGGAIALGHPLGCTAAKLSVQIVHEMKRRNEKYGLVTMCIGGGQGAAGVFELCV